MSLETKCLTIDSALSVTKEDETWLCPFKLKKNLEITFSLLFYLQSNTWEYGHGYFQQENFQNLMVILYYTDQSS